ncbi:MAG: glycosyltransferase family 2 protein [Nostocoides sp.]
MSLGRRMEDPGTAPSVTAVIPHYGDPEPTIRLVEQLRASRLVPQIIVSDDSSPTPFPDRPGITVVRRAANGGYGSAVNSGAAQAAGELLLILNSDLEIEPTAMDHFIAEAAAWMPAVIGPGVTNRHGAADYTGRYFPTTSHQAVEWLTPLARWREQSVWHRAVGHDTQAVPGTITAVDWLVGAFLLLPRKDFEAVGGFDERFYMNSEEIDLQRRLADRGLPRIYLGTHQVVHEGGGSSESAARRRWLTQSRWTYADKWGGTGRLTVALTMATAANLVWNGARRALGRDCSPLATARYELDLIRRRA